MQTANPRRPACTHISQTKSVLTVGKADKYQGRAPNGRQRVGLVGRPQLLLALLLPLLRCEHLLLPAGRQSSCVCGLKHAAIRAAQLADCDSPAVLAHHQGHQEEHAQPRKHRRCRDPRRALAPVAVCQHPHGWLGHQQGLQVAGSWRRTQTQCKADVSIFG